MAVIEDFLEPLAEGVWEVTIRKDQVSGPPGPDWVTSPLNVPTPGTIASFRKGQYHLHETASSYKVHLDRYDPVHHPVMHLVDDAPFLLMISETFITLFSITRRASIAGIAGQLQNQVSTYRNHLILGMLAIIIGFCFLLIPDLIFYGIVGLIIPSLVCIAGILSLISGLSFRPAQVSDRDDIIRGFWIIGIALVLYMIPSLFWALCILFITAVWMFATSIILLRRILRGRRAVPEGFISRLLIGIGSLLLGVFSLVAPAPVFYLLLDILGILVMTTGGISILIGLRLRDLMRPVMPAAEKSS